MNKTCKKCGEIKSHESFTRSKQNKDGRHSYCTACKTSDAKLRRATNPEHYAAKQAEYDKRYAEKYPDRRRAYRLEWDSENHERILEAQRAWIESNRDKVRLYVRMQHAKRRSGDGRNSYKHVEKMMKMQKGMCATCRSLLVNGYHIDHIVPLKLGGGNEQTNLQLLCPKCNLSKKDKHPIDFMQSRGFLL